MTKAKLKKMSFEEAVEEMDRTYDNISDRDRLVDIAKNALDKRWLIEHHKAIFDKIQSYAAVSDIIDSTDEKYAVDGWDVNFYLNYCPYFQRG
jgi:hypothetical protein